MEKRFDPILLEVMNHEKWRLLTDGRAMIHTCLRYGRVLRSRP